MPVKLPPDKGIPKLGLKGATYYKRKYPERQKTPVDNPPIVNTTVPNPRILASTAVSRDHILKSARPGEPEPYVYGYTAVRPMVIGADDSGEYLVLDLLWSVGEISQIEGPYLYIPDVGSVSIGASSPTLHENFLGTTGQSASTIMTALKGSYPAYAGKAHSVVSMQIGWNLNIMGFIYGRLVRDPRLSPTTTTAYSANPALILADVLTLCGYTMDWDSVATAANYCDEGTGTNSPLDARWEIGIVINERKDLQSWVHSLAAYASCFVDIRGPNAYLIPDTPRASSHTYTADDMIEGTCRVRYRGSRSAPSAVKVNFKSFIDRTFETIYPDPTTTSPWTEYEPGTVADLQMPGWNDFARAKRKAEEVYRKAQRLREVEFMTFDKGLLRTVGDVGTLTNAAYGLNADTFVLTEIEEVERGRHRLTYAQEYNAADYSDQQFSGTAISTQLFNPYYPPPGSTPTLTAELVTSASPNYYRIKIDFAPQTWAYLQDYKVDVYIDGVPATILHSEYVAKGSETGSPLTITVYADRTDSPGFAMSIGNSPQTVYRVDVYNRSLWTNQDGTEVLSAVPGTATITDPIAVYFNSNPLTSFELAEFGATTLAAIDFDGTDAQTGDARFRWNYSSQATIIEPLVEGSFGAGEWLVMYDNIVEIFGNDSATFFELNNSYQPGTWVDANGARLRILDQSANSPQQAGQVYSCDLHFAQDNGSGAPVASTIVTKPVTLISWAAENWYYDLFTGTNGTLLENHAPTDPAPVSPQGWEILSGSFEISSNRVISSGGSPLPVASACIDMGDTDVAWRGAVFVWGETSGDEVALIGRVQDANNYWQLKLTDTGTADPVLSLNEVISGTPTTRATVTMTGKGPISDSFHQLMRLTFSGNNILGAICIKSTSSLYVSSGTSPDAVWTVSYTSTSYNTETRFGIQCFQDNASWDSVFGSMVEPDWLSYIDDYVQGP